MPLYFLISQHTKLILPNNFLQIEGMNTLLEHENLEKYKFNYPDLKK